MSRLETIVRVTRRSGNTTWILNSAIFNPNCIIVSRTPEHANYLEKEYDKLIKKLSWYKKLYWIIKGRKKPKFLSLSSDFYTKNKMPVIFDNGSLV